MEAPPGETAQAPATPGEETQTAAAPMATTTAPEAGAAVTRIPIAGGEPSGTPVGQQVQQVRATLVGLQDRIQANSQRLAVLHASEASSAASYSNATSFINSRLLVGSAHNNAELVAQWNIAQDALDRMAADVNALNALGAGIGADKSFANITLSTIRSLNSAPGAADEDRRQLGELEDGANRTVALLDQLQGDVSRDMQRATVYVTNERATLTRLASTIKSGDIYSENASPPATLTQPAVQPSTVTGSVTSSTPLVVIKFDKPNVEYQQTLYAALSQALERKPEAGFQVVAVSPSTGSVESMQVAQSETERNAQAVLRSMTSMGVPASRLALSSTTDPSVQSSEVRVYVR